MLRQSFNVVKIKIKVIEKIQATIRRSVKLIWRYDVSLFLIEGDTADSPAKDFLDAFIDCVISLTLLDLFYIIILSLYLWKTLAMLFIANWIA